MWKDYFGDKCKIYGVDIVEECKAYEDDSVKIFIGNQGDRNFWKEFRKKVPRVDILVDDGAHLLKEQTVTLEEMLPHISPGGVYLCEDVTGERNHLTPYFAGIQNHFNTINSVSSDKILSKSTGFQQQINSIHHYPYVFVIEKREELLNELKAPKHGTIWGPFFAREYK